MQEDQQQTEIEFLSPSLVTNITKNQDTTPQPIDVSTPNKDNDIDARLEIHQIKIIPQKQQQEEALKIINQLHQMAFRDTRYLSNAIKTERNSIIALTMCFRLGRCDPSDKFTETYKNKDVIKLYKIVTEERLTKTNTLYKIYGHIYTMKERIKLTNKTNIYKDKLNKTKLPHFNIIQQM